MKRVIFAWFLLCSMSLYGQVTVDTLYYEKSGAKAEHPAFAEFYRIAISKKDGSSKYRDFSINGNKLIAEGGFTKIDSDDDTKTLFNGKNIFYDNIGNITSEVDYIAGKLHGSCIEYYPSGAIRSTSFYTNDKPDGPFVSYSEDGKIKTQQDYVDGNFLNPYYTLNSHGYISKYNSLNDKPVYDMPEVGKIEKQVIDNKNYYIYRVNGVCIIANLALEQTGVGRYFKLSLFFANYSQFPVTFNPIPDSALKIQNPDKNNEKIVNIKTYTENEFVDKARNRQAWNEALLGFTMVASAAASGIAAANTYTHSTIRYNTSLYNVNTINVSTVSYNPAISRLVASEEAYRAGLALRRYSERFAQGLENITSEYLSPITVEPCQTVSGYVFLQFKEIADMILITLKVNHIPYTFEFTPNIVKHGMADYKIYQ